MFFPEGQTRVHLYGYPTDMRKSFDGLYALTREGMQRDPLNGDLSVSRNISSDTFAAMPTRSPTNCACGCVNACRLRCAGERCQCGEPIWVIGSALAGHACFTCITGEATPSGDYEIDEVLAASSR